MMNKTLSFNYFLLSFDDTIKRPKKLLVESRIINLSLSKPLIDIRSLEHK